MERMHDLLLVDFLSYNTFDLRLYGQLLSLFNEYFDYSQGKFQITFHGVNFNIFGKS